MVVREDTTSVTDANEKLLTACKGSIDSILSDLHQKGREYDDVNLHVVLVEMWAKLLNRRDNVLDESNIVAVWRAAFHHAVDSYFRIFLGLKRGRPRIDPAVKIEMERLRKQGKSYQQIANKYRLTREATRKRIKTRAPRG